MLYSRTDSRHVALTWWKRRLMHNSSSSPTPEEVCITSTSTTRLRRVRKRNEEKPQRVQGAKGRSSRRSHLSYMTTSGQMYKREQSLLREIHSAACEQRRKESGKRPVMKQMLFDWCPSCSGTLILSP